MPRISDIVYHLHQIAPPSYQESYDNSGLLVGNAQADVKGVMVSLDMTEAVIDEAVEKGCNLVVAHHPIIFGGLKRLTGDNYVQRVVLKAIKADVALFAIHTNLDNVYHQGVNAKIAEKLNLTQTRILSPKPGLLRKLVVFVPRAQVEQVRSALFEAGAGHIGNYAECSFSSEGQGSFKAGAGTNPHVGAIGERHYEAEERVEVVLPKNRLGQVLQALLAAHPYEEVAYDIYPLENSYATVGSGMIGELEQPIPSMDFLQFLKKALKTEGLRYTQIHKDTVQRIALCGGAGSFLLPKALQAKADVFITGDYKYHQFFDADGQIIIADVGHYESEQFTIDLLYELLSKKFSTFDIYCTSINTNPINYL